MDISAGTYYNKLWEILLPTTTPQGNNIDLEYHKLWDKKVLEITKGLTILNLTANGQWISADNGLFVEKMIPVRISCTDEQIQIIADLTAEHYQQLAIFFYKISDEVYVKYYKN